MNFQLLTVTLLYAVTLPTLTAQKKAADRTGGYSINSEYGRLYNPKTVVTFTGRVTGLSISPPTRGMDPAATLIVKAINGGEILVDLGPAWYINHQSTNVQLKDSVNVTGSKIMIKGKGTVLASRVVVNEDQAMVLRDAAGFPVWDAFRTAPPANIADFRSINGTIQSVDSDRGVATVQTPDGSVIVQTGPLWYNQHQNYQLNVGDNLTFYAGPTQQVSPGVFVTTDMAQIANGYIILRNGNNPIWDPWVQTNH